MSCAILEKYLNFLKYIYIYGKNKANLTGLLWVSKEMCETSLSTVSTTWEVTDMSVKFLLPEVSSFPPLHLLITSNLSSFIHLYVQGESSLTICPSPHRKHVIVKETNPGTGLLDTGGLYLWCRVLACILSLFLFISQNPLVVPISLDSHMLLLYITSCQMTVIPGLVQDGLQHVGIKYKNFNLHWCFRISFKRFYCVRNFKHVEQMCSRCIRKINIVIIIKQNLSHSKHSSECFTDIAI